MSATYFDTVKRQVRQQGDGVARSPFPCRAGRRPAPGVGLLFGLAASLGIWVVIGKVVVSLIG